MNVSGSAGTLRMDWHLPVLRIPVARQLAPATGILATALLVLLLVLRTGGLPNVLVNAMYAILALAAYAYGWRGGFATSVLIAVLLGPLAIASGMRTDGVQAWAIRALSFGLIGTLIGVLFDRMRSRALELEATVIQVRARECEGMLALARGAEAKDTDLGDHIRRVQLTSEALAIAAGVAPGEVAGIGYAAMLHDVGKLHVPDRILLKPGPLDREEWDIMRRHTVWGERILADGDGFAIARRIARWHHENFDGTGYPDGLARDAIPLEARIVRLADSFDAMTNDRPYSRARTVEDALEELHRYANVQFDPDLVALMTDLIRDHDGLAARLAALQAAAGQERIIAWTGTGRIA